MYGLVARKKPKKILASSPSLPVGQREADVSMGEGVTLRSSAICATCTRAATC